MREIRLTVITATLAAALLQVLTQLQPVQAQPGIERKVKAKLVCTCSPSAILS